MDFQKLNKKIAAPNKAVIKAAKASWDSIAKPIGSLGLLEQSVIKIAGLTGDEKISLEKCAVLVLCADNGVVIEGVTQVDSHITAIVAENISKGDASVCRMAAIAKADVIPVDMGMIKKVETTGLLDRRIAQGTDNIAVGPAMSAEQAAKAIGAGIELVNEMKAQGYRMIATGEMGIGNTTTSSAVASVLINRPVNEVTGYGAGLSDEGLRCKIDVIERAIRINKPNPEDAFDVLMKLGGFDIAGMTGIILGGALFRIPILLDGFISGVSALIASKLCPASVCAMIPTHVSAEPAGRMVLDALGLKPLICAEMRLGEGTGAVAAIPLLRMALAVYEEMPTFQDIGIKAYDPAGVKS